MAKTYYLSATNSDISSADAFDKKLSEVKEAAGTLSVLVGDKSSSTGHAYTELGKPGFSGVIGGYTLKVNVITAGDVDLEVRLARVNASGATLSGGAFTDPQSLNTTGVKTFTFGRPNLGTWGAGNRLEVEFNFVNSTMSNITIDIGTGTADESIETPFENGGMFLLFM